MSKKYSVIKSNNFNIAFVTGDDAITSPPPSALALYGLRLLDSAYTGDAIGVRRASDNATSGIGFVASDLDVATLTTFSNGGDVYITNWYDQLGYGRSLSQTTTTLQPKIVSSGNVIVDNYNKPRIQFVNTNYLSGSGALLNNHNLSLIFVKEYEYSTSSNFIFQLGQAGYQYNYLQLADITKFMQVLYIGDGERWTSFGDLQYANEPSTPTIQSFIFNGSGLQQYRNLMLSHSGYPTNPRNPGQHTDIMAIPRPTTRSW